MKETSKKHRHSTTTRKIPPLVSTDWLMRNIASLNPVIIDIRASEEYSKSHIPNALNVPFLTPVSAWAITRGDIFLELPNAKELFQVIGSNGIREDSPVVIVDKIGNPYVLAHAPRVAMTLIYAGVKNVAILDGGHDKWMKEGKPLTSDRVTSEPIVYKGKTEEGLFVSKNEVLKKIALKNNILIVDARNPEFYFGIAVEPYAPKIGHIPGAKNLPAPWVWNEDGTYRNLEVLRAIAEGVVGKDSSREIILYCGVGGFASVWAFILRELLGYKNVKIFDGAWQEWIKEPSGPVSIYKWE
ncbi:MAG: sulfurtransferase [Candidatus Bathyarchaeia archaeon]